MIIDSATWDLGYLIEVIEWTRAKRYANGDHLEALKAEMKKKKKKFSDNGWLISLKKWNMMLTLNIYHLKQVKDYKGMISVILWCPLSSAESLISIYSTLRITWIASIRHINVSVDIHVSPAAICWPTDSGEHVYMFMEPKHWSSVFISWWLCSDRNLLQTLQPYLLPNCQSCLRCHWMWAFYFPNLKKYNCPSVNQVVFFFTKQNKKRQAFPCQLSIWLCSLLTACLFVN